MQLAFIQTHTYIHTYIYTYIHTYAVWNRIQAEMQTFEKKIANLTTTMGTLTPKHMGNGYNTGQTDQMYAKNDQDDMSMGNEASIPTGVLWSMYACAYVCMYM